MNKSDMDPDNRDPDNKSPGDMSTDAKSTDAKHTDQALVNTNPPPPSPTAEGTNEMPFLEHLEELRWRLLKALGAVFAGALVCFLFSDALFNIMMAPYDEAVSNLENHRSSDLVETLKGYLATMTGSPVQPAPPIDPDATLPPERYLQSLKPMTTFFVILQVALMGGFMLALPVVFYQFWRFIAPGLLDQEKNLILPVITLSVVCFSLGTALAYGLVLPLGLQFFLGLDPPGTTSQWAIDEYIGFVIRLILGFGLVFELPVLALFLSRLGILTPEYMRRIRRYAVIGIFVVAAIFTPPDPISQMMMALPIMALYEISIWICVLARPRPPKS
jgi:sec-independent protein translocase protein TatC